jgi:transposase-like protein
MAFAQASADLGINELMLRTWSHQSDAEGQDAFRGHGVRTEQDARIAAPERENRILWGERDIKKTTEFFVKENR